MHFNRKKIKLNDKLSIKSNLSKNKKYKPQKINKKFVSSYKKKIGPPIHRRRDNIIYKKYNKKKKLFKSKKSISNKLSSGKYLPLSKWTNKLNKEVAFLLGNGPSISEQPLEILNNYFTIGANRIFLLYHPTVLFWQDIELWKRDRKNIMSSSSIKIARNISDPNNIAVQYRLIKGWFDFAMQADKIHGTGNTGVLMTQLAASLGCRALVLLGMDCKYEDGKTDFYGKNKDHKAYTIQMCNNAMKWLHKKSPVPIYNCSNIDLWEKRKLQNVIDELKPEKRDFNYYKKIFEK